MARIISAFKQFLDGSGDPLVNGWLRFTESGTNNTDKATYKDSSETIPNTNPLQLDAEGRCPNVFGSGSYKVRLYTNDEVGGGPGVQIQEFDPVGGVSGTAAFDDWNALSIYQIADIVTGPDGKYYKAITADNVGKTPAANPSDWLEITFFVGGALPGDLQGHVEADNGTVVLENGTDGTDATFTGDILAIDSSVVLDSGTDGTDASFTGDVLSENGNKVVDIELATATFNGLLVGNSQGDHIGDVLAGDTTQILENGTDGTDAWIKADLKADNGTTVFNPGTDGTDALYAGTIRGEVQAPNGVTVLDNGTDGTDATFTGDVTGDLTGNVTGNVTGDLTGNADTATALDDQGSTDTVLVKIIDIGAWDMDNTVAITVAHGLDKTKIVTVNAIIFQDGSESTQTAYMIAGDANGPLPYGYINVDATSVVLGRVTGGRFDTGVFSDGVQNRGKITIWYTN